MSKVNEGKKNILIKNTHTNGKIIIGHNVCMLLYGSKVTKININYINLP